jgi:hypothetical protein
MKILRAMTDYLGGLRSFVVHTDTTIEDELAPGQRVDYDTAVSVGVKRPDKLRALRVGELADQRSYYDGTTLTLHATTEGLYATMAAPPTLGGMLDFAREDLGLILPGSDLVYDNAYSILAGPLTSAVVVGKAVIAGVTCDHLAFRHPDMDFQLWVADEGPPLPYKYIVTDITTPTQISTVTVMREWIVNPDLDDALFVFDKPEGAVRIDFVVGGESTTTGP